MKKSLLALAALGAFAGAASAQSTVTLFGIVDVNIRQQDNKGSSPSGSVTTVSTDGINSSRLGFRGVEDLGGGLRAGFWLEGALTPDDGTAGGQQWRRRSTVSLLGAFGEIRLGRDYTPTFWNHTIFDPFGTNGVGAETNVITQQGETSPFNSGAGTLVRANNSVGYFLPALGGFYGQFMLAAGENTTGNKYYAGRLGYGAGPVNVAGAYGVTKRTGTMADDLKAWNVGGTYNLGFLALYGQYHVYSYSNRDLKSAMLGLTVPIGAGTIKATYNKTKYDVTTTSSANADQVALGYQYDLSKRTALYGNLAMLKNKSGVKFQVAGTANNWATGVTGKDSTAYEVGVRHSF